MIDQPLMALRIARFALRRSWGAIVAFSAALFIFQATLIIGYRLIGGAPTVQSLVQTISPELRRALKIMPTLQGGFGPREYVALGLYHPIYLGLGAAFGVSRAADALAGSLERGTVALILTRPVSRAALVLGEALALLAGVGCVALAGLSGLWAGLLVDDLGVPFGPYALAALAGSWLFGVLALIGLLASALSRRASTAAGLGSSLVLSSFVLDLLPGSAAPPLAWINPWHWYDPPQIIATGIRWQSGLALAGMALTALLLTIWIWQRRDLVA